MPNVIEGHIAPRDCRIGIACARWNGLITRSLCDGAVDALVRHGVPDANITVAWAPGSYELPLLLARMADSQKYDGLVALGAVIRGATPHFDYVAGECSRGVHTVMMNSHLPVGFGVLTTDSIEQALERAGSKAGNKGAEAALTVLEMLSLLEQV